LLLLYKIEVHHSLVVWQRCAFQNL